MLLKNPKTPLLYPYDKPRAASLVASHIPEDTKRIVSPFLGGGSIELALAARGYEVDANTSSRLLYDFWDCVQRDPERVYQMAMGFHPIADPKLFYMLQKKIYQPHDEFMRAALFYILALCAENHAATSGNIEPGTPSFNQLRLMQMSKFECEGINFCLGDAIKLIKESEDFLVCVPPPYIASGYTNAIVIPEAPQINHADFAELMSDREDWMILYNYHENLRDLYPDNQLIMLDAACRETHREDRAAEVLILGS